MKSSLAATAKAFLDLAETCDPAKCGALCDSAVHYLCECGCSPTDLSAFLRAVRVEAQKRERIVAVRLTTPTGKSGTHGKLILEALERASGSKLSLQEDADPGLIGGAQLSRGDDRFDYSLRGALDRFATHLTTT